MDKRNNKDFPPVGLIVFGFIFWWPLGLGLLLYKVGVFDGLKNAFSGGSRSMADSQEQARMRKYKLMSIGANALSIEHMASAVGISYESCLRDVQKMVYAGEFGSEAYINYVDKTLVLTQSRGTFVGTPNYAANFRNGASTPTARYSSDKYRSAGTSPTAGTGRADTGRSSSYQPAVTTEKERRAQKLRKPFGAAPALLLAAGIFCLAMGVVGFSTEIDSLLSGTRDLFGLTLAGFFTAAGVTSLTSRFTLKKRAARFTTYAAAVGPKDYISLEELRSTTGVNQKTLQRDLEIMIEKGLFGDEAYIDQGAGLLILKPDAAPQREAEPEPEEDGEDRYRAILREIRKVNDDIPDPDISARIDRMEDLTSRIFKAVQEKPERLPQIKSFMSYYLPTALKLLHSYAEFDASGAGGENVQTAKADIERILDMLVDGFQKQLDKLYESDAMDISSDIDVLENMLRRDGLSGESDFGQVMGGH